MATFDQMSLSMPGCADAGGAVFYLAHPARRPVIVRLPSNAEVEIRAGCPALVVRGLAASSYEAALELALSAANCALDLLAIRGVESLVLADHDVRHVVLWTNNGVMRLRIWSVATLSMSMSISGSRSVRGRGDPAPPIQQWDESFRYFRHSQATDDLFDAFRNMYLALESVLSVFAPVKVASPGRFGKVIAMLLGHPPSGKPEGETVWLKRALRAAHVRLPLTPFTGSKSSPSNAVKKLHGDLRRVRNAVFHAKRGIAAHLPYRTASKKEVGEALSRFGRLYIALAGDAFGTHFGTGGFTHIAFQGMVESVSPQTVHVSDDATPVASDDTRVNPAGGKTMALPTTQDPAFNGPFLAGVRGEASGQEISDCVDFIRRIATTHNGSVVVVESLERALTVDDVGIVEVVVGARGMNTQTLRSRYSS
jgi:hypothetical protein